MHDARGELTVQSSYGVQSSISVNEVTCEASSAHTDVPVEVWPGFSSGDRVYQLSTDLGADMGR